MFLAAPTSSNLQKYQTENTEMMLILRLVMMMMMIMMIGVRE